MNSPPPATTNPSVLIVILNWNAPAETADAVASVLNMDYDNFSIAIIENGSTDDSVAALTPILSDRVRMLQSPVNLGYTGGCNLGFDLALKENFDYVWLLNSDAITPPHTLTSLVATAESSPTIGMVSPLIASITALVPDQSRYVHVAGLFNPAIPSCESTRDPEVARQWMQSSPERVMLLGTALLVKVALVRAIGKLDSDLFAYWEDCDFSVRTFKAGFRNVVDFNSVVHHTEKSAKDAVHEIKPHYWYYMARNESRFWKKHLSGTARLKPLWWAYNTQVKFLTMLGDNQVSRDAILAGLWHGWTGRTGPYKPGMSIPAPVASLILAHTRKVAATL